MVRGCLAIGLLMFFSMGCSLVEKLRASAKPAGNTRVSSTPGKSKPGISPSDSNVIEVNLLESRDDIRGFISELTNAAGTENPNLLKLSFYDSYAMAEVQNPKKPDDVDAYTYREGRLSGPNPVKLNGDGKIGDNVFPLKDVNIDGIPALTVEILAKLKDVEGGKLIGYSISRNLPFSKEIHVQPLADATRKSVSADADNNAKLKKFEIK